MLWSGEDGRTLFMVLARWSLGPERMEQLIEASHRPEVATARVDVPHAGWP